MMIQNFRLSLSVSPYPGDFEGQGIRYTDGNRTASTLHELQELFIRHGSSEMWARVNMQRYGDPKGHALENSVKFIKLGKELNVPVNVELMCVGKYMDMSRQDTVDFSQYPELNVPGKPWSDCSLDEMCTALTAYGEAAAKQIMGYGCRVNMWDIGNETNFGFAGINVGIPTVVNPKLAKASPSFIYPRPHLGANWLAKNVWRYNAKQFAAVAAGIRRVDPSARFSIHISTAIADTYYTVKYFKTMQDNGFTPDEAGISFYPSAPGPWHNQFRRLKKIVHEINTICCLPVFIAEYAYPSRKMEEGEFKSWKSKAKGYDLSEAGQAQFLHDIISWGKNNGLSGIRPFAPDFIGAWEPMALFAYDDKTGLARAKQALMQLGG